MEKENNKKFKKWWIYLIAIIIIIGILGSNSDNETNTNNAIQTNTNNIESKKEDKIIFLKGSNGKDFYEILCEVGNIEKRDGVKVGDTIDYTSSNDKFGIEIETNQNNEINWISIYTLLLADKNEYENFFLTISRLEYNNSNKNEIYNWIHDNLGKEATTKIGDANFKLYNGTLEKPILEVFTDGNEEFQKEQIEKLN